MLCIVDRQQQAGNDFKVGLIFQNRIKACGLAIRGACRLLATLTCTEVAVAVRLWA